MSLLSQHVSTKCTLMNYNKSQIDLSPLGPDLLVLIKHFNSGFRPEPHKINSMVFLTVSSKNFQQLSIKIDLLTSWMNLEKISMLSNCCFYHFLLFHPVACFRLIKSKTGVIFDQIGRSILSSRSCVTCALNLTEYERRFFFKRRYLFFLSPAFCFPEFSAEDVSIN